MLTVTGSCHCGKIKFEIEVNEIITVQECNCSICSMTGYVHLIIPGAKFRLLSGEEYLSTYEFNTKTAKHTFCNKCGIKSFYIPRSNPNGYSVNLRCIDQTRFTEITVEKFDGRNWEKSGYKLKHLSED